MAPFEWRRAEMADGLRITIADGVARLTLDRPAAGNAIDLPMARALLEAARSFRDDPIVRCVLLTGTGRLFCVGGDISAFAAQRDRIGEYIEEITAALHGALACLLAMDKPIVTAINGPAAGAGIGLAAIGDIALSAPEAHFTSAYTAIGMTPDGGATWLLPRLIGLRRTMDLILTNRRVEADEAAAIGLVTRVTAPGALDEEAAALAVQLAAGPTIAYAVSRRLSLASLANGFEDHLAAESRAIAAQARGAEGREGVAAFLAKRPPHFAGPNE